jgi:hypothetical protein
VAVSIGWNRRLQSRAGRLRSEPQEILHYKAALVKARTTSRARRENSLGSRQRKHRHRSGRFEIVKADRRIMAQSPFVVENFTSWNCDRAPLLLR